MVLSVILAILAPLTVNLQAAPLTEGAAIPLTGTKGRFDFIRFDEHAGRLLLGHTGNKSFDVFDVASGKLLKSFLGYAAADGASDPSLGYYYASCSDPARMLIVDSKTLSEVGAVSLPANSDLMNRNPVSGKVYVCDDTAPRLWVVNPVLKNIASTIPLEGSGMEDLAFSKDGKKAYQAVKGAESITVLDDATGKVEGIWPCGMKGPWGLASAPEINGLLAACSGKLLLFDCATGKVTALAPIADRVDELAYDGVLHIAYCSSRQGVISAVAVQKGKLTPLGDIPTQKGCGNVAVDVNTHTVWIAYGDDQGAFVKPFFPNR